MILLLCYTMCQMTLLILNHGYFLKYQIPWNTQELAGIGVSFLVEGFLVWNAYKNYKGKEHERQIEELKYATKLERIERHSRMAQEENLRQKTMDFQKQIREARQSIREQKEIERQIPKYYCGNTILNVLLEEKEIQCRRRKIKLEIEPIYVSELPGISRIHLCSVLSNLLDNAIEAVSCLEEDRCWIKVAIYQKTRYLVIRVENPCSESYLNQKKGPSRGYGSRILKEIAGIYGGNVLQRVNQENGGEYLGTVILRTDMEKT